MAVFAFSLPMSPTSVSSPLADLMRSTSLFMAAIELSSTCDLEALTFMVLMELTWLGDCASWPSCYRRFTIDVMRARVMVSLCSRMSASLSRFTLLFVLKACKATGLIADFSKLILYSLLNSGAMSSLFKLLWLPMLF